MKKKTYQILVVFAILSVFIAFSIAGYSIYQKNKAKSNETGQASDIETLDPENPEVKEAKAEYSLNIEDDPIERLDDESVPSNSSIEIHFFDVGEGDSTLVACDGKVMLIDGGNPGSSRFLYSYLKQHEINYLDYVICSHAHEDHVGGLAGALNYATVGTVYAPVKEYDTRAFKSFVKYVEQHGNELTIPKAGDIFSLGKAKVEIIGPVDMSLAENNENNSSIIVHIIFGETSFLIMGDAEIEEEASYEIARRSRGTPRIANLLLRRVRDFAQVQGNGIIDLDIAKVALSALNVDINGLDEMDNKILSAVIEKFGGGPVGLTTIATAVSEDAGTIEEVYEPFLIQEGYLIRTPRGRQATELAYKHLGKEIFNRTDEGLLF